MSSGEALGLAEDRNLDLVEVAPEAKPPVCKILDYGKFKYQQQQKDKVSKKKQHVIKLKEIRFRPRIDDHDLKMKINMARRFLDDGCKVKLTVMFRGRELAHKEFGMQLLNRIIEGLSDVAEFDKAPISEGRTIVAYITSK